jgi:hypothetical protein
MQALQERPTVRGIPEALENQIWANGRWLDTEELEADLELSDEDFDLIFGGIDGEEFMGTGTAFDTDEQGPVYTPGH